MYSSCIQVRRSESIEISISHRKEHVWAVGTAGPSSSVTRTPLHVVLSALFQLATTLRVFGLGIRLLADEEHIYSAKIEVIVERKRRKAVVSGMLASVKLSAEEVSAHSLQATIASCSLTMTVFPLYWMMWHDRPTSLPPPRQRNMSSSDGSIASSVAAAFIADAFRFDAMMSVVA